MAKQLEAQFDHLGVVVDDIDRAKRFLEGLGFVPGRARSRLPAEMAIPERGLRISFLHSGDFEVELILIEMMSGQTRDPRPHIDHIGVLVDDFSDARRRLEAQGVLWETQEVQHVASSDTSYLMTDPSSSGGIKYQILTRGKATRTDRHQASK